MSDASRLVVCQPGDLQNKEIYNRFERLTWSKSYERTSISVGVDM